MEASLGISEVKARLAAVCDQAAQGEVIRFTRRRGNRVETFELRRVESARRRLGSWQDKFSEAELESLTAPLSDEELAHMNRCKPFGDSSLYRLSAAIHWACIR
jgi:hypothetical protein